MRRLFLIILLTGGWDSIAEAGTLLSIDGPDSASNGLGYWSMGYDWLAQSWTQTDSYQNVSISAAIFNSLFSGDSATAYLMNAIGASATVANELVSTSVAVPYNSDSLLPLFSGLTLGPGTYYLVIYGARIEDSWAFTSGSNIALGSGVSYGSGVYATTWANYAPSSDFAVNPDTTHSGRMLVTGDAVGTTPEPGTCALIASGLIGLTAVRRRSR